jgi:hypothetical protein
VTIPIPDRSPVVQAGFKAPGGRSAPLDDLVEEIAALVALLTEVVRLAEKRAIFPSQWALIAELALEHDSVRAALQTEGIGSSHARC